MNNVSQSNQLLFVKSSQAIKNESDDSYHFSNPISANRGNRILCELVEAEIPVTYYLFTERNNFFSFTITGDVVNEGVNISLPLQNFTSTELISYLNTLFTTSFTNFTVILSYNSQTLKLILTVTPTGQNSSVSAITINPSTTCSKHLGFVASQSGSSPLVAKNCINLNRTLNIYVKTNLKLNNLDSHGLINGTISKVQVDKSSGEIIHYHNIEGIKFLIADKNIDHLQIVLEDDDGERLDLNGIEYHLTFAFLYTKETLQEYVATLIDKLDEIELKLPEPEEE